MSGFSGSPPASSKRTRRSGRSVSLAASTQPADPAPTTMMSASVTPAPGRSGPAVDDRAAAPKFGTDLRSDGQPAILTKVTACVAPRRLIRQERAEKRSGDYG